MNSILGRRLMCSAVLACCFSVSSSASSGFPMAEGNWWRLESKTWQGLTIDVRLNQVRPGPAGTTHGEMELISPWGNYAFLIRLSPAGIFHEGFRFNGEESRFAIPVALFPAGRAGESWTTMLGNVTLVSTNLNVSAAGEELKDVSLYRIEYWNGDRHSWMVSPTAGIVQFGEGAAAFVMSAKRANPPDARHPVRGGHCPLPGIDWNPSAAEGFSETSKDRVAAGIQPWTRYVDIAATWSDLEPAPGQYRFSAILAELNRAAKNGAKVSLTLKPLDGPNRQLPANLTARAWNDGVLLSRWTNLLEALRKSMQGKIVWLHVANEVDSYFLPRQDELAAFESFLAATQVKLKADWPDVSVGLVHAYDTVRTNDSVFHRLLWFSDHIGFTYYGLDRLATRSRQSIEGDLTQLQLLSGDRRIVLTELGHPSDLGDQAGFYEQAMAVLVRASGRVEAARFFQLNELPKEVVSQLTTAYGYNAASPFVRFLASLGVHDSNGQAKQAWEVYRTGALRLQIPDSCWVD